MARRTEALRSLAAALEAGVPELMGHVAALQPARILSHPTVEILPVRWKYLPDQAAEHRGAAPGPGNAVLNVGRDEGTIQIKMAHRTDETRLELEEKILDLFAGAPGRPGVLLTEVATLPAIGRFTCAWELDGEEWQDEMSFNVRFWSTITVMGQVPKLVTRRGLHRMRNLQFGVTARAGAAWGDADVEKIRVNGDGTTSKL